MKSLAPFQTPSFKKSMWQVVNSFGPYFLIWGALYFVHGWMAFALAFLAGLFLLRIFIIFHDCGHHSFFNSVVANDIVGTIGGLLVFTPYYHWRWEHLTHHATAGNLDRRGAGDVWTMTVQEYLESSRWKRSFYRLVRNPFFLFLIAPLILFLGWQRIPSSKAPVRERNSVYWTTAILALIVWGGCSIFGVLTYVTLQLTVLAVASSIGVWLFYVQHQFDGVYWARRKDWDFTTAALKGSSYYRLPRILQWFTGNIGFHHIHHLNPRVPNYHLERCHNSDPLFETVTELTLFSSFRSFAFRLWDEQQGKLVGYRAAFRSRRSGRV